MAFEHGTVNRDKVQGSSQLTSKEYRLKVGTTHLRILPPHKNSDVWWTRSQEHWLSPGYVPCPRTINEACPLCEEGERLHNEGTEESIEASGEFRPREQYYFNCVVISSPEGAVTAKNGVQILRSGIKVYRQLKTFDNDEAGDWGDMTNIEKGFDVRIERQGSGRNDTEYQVRPVPNKPLEAVLKTLEVPMDSLELLDLDEYRDSLRLPYEEMKVRYDSKQVAPGFPGGPRRSVVEVLEERPNSFEVPTVDTTTTVEGDFTPPPTLEN